MNRDDYIDKMNHVLSDNSKFSEVGPPEFSLIYRIEDTIYRNLKQLKDDSTSFDHTYRFNTALVRLSVFYTAYLRSTR